MITSSTSVLFDAARKLIILSDLEPDDRRAFQIFASVFDSSNILMVGSTVMQAARKKALIEKELKGLKIGEIPVYQGSGGTPGKYNADVNSTKAARTYENEGKGILDESVLSTFHSSNHSSNELQEEMIKTLSEAEERSIEIALLAPPTDLVKIFNVSENLRRKIKNIDVMGGWREITANDKTICRTTYNWDMDPKSSAELLSFSDIPMTLYSTHVITKAFPGGSINSKTFPTIIEKIKECQDRIPSLNDTKKATISWNKHVIKTIPRLESVITPFIDHQFTPADPLVAVGMINPKLISSTSRVDVKIDLNDKTELGCRVDVSENPLSHITLVTGLNTDVFKEEMIASYDRLIKKLA